MRTIKSFAFGLLLVGLSAASAGCNTDAFCFSCSEPNEVDGGAGGSGAGNGGTGGEGGDLFVDGGNTGPGGAGGQGGGGCGDTQSDPKNCGACGNVCNLLGAFPKCVNGVCEIDTCASGFIDLDGVGDNGCEYVCATSNGGVEVCDGKDNDCNGVVDEGFDLTNDPQNCGACGVVCSLANATAGCAPVSGFPTCVVTACDMGFSDVDGLDVNGCEYTCAVNPPVAEACNSLDDNCNGQINEGNPGGGASCMSSCPGGVCKGECTPGTTLCAGSSLICVPGLGPTIESCDGKDNDCDGVVDNGFDIQNDPLNCGGCGQTCMLVNAIGGCNGGQCVISACQPGYTSLDGDPSNGCEYQCPVTPVGVESCNGLDDDCNGVVDDAAVIAAQKPIQALCYPAAGTPCAGADFVCLGQTGWKCNYGPGVEVSASGTLAFVESKCDGVDGNCNGQVDEAFADLGTECDNGLLGACRDSGKRICDPMDVTQTVCDLTPLPNPTPGSPSAEACNGLDDDCDGLVDDSIVDDMVVVTVGMTSFSIDRYEASRPDATSSNAGLKESRRCVKPNVLPWTKATQAEALAACQSTGARLCTANEIVAACAGAAGNAYPYGATYQPLTCNGLDYDGVPGGANDNVLVPTGAAALPMCATPLGIYDLSGNAAEWTSTVTGTTGAPLNLSIYVAKGGSYLSPSAGLTCQFDLSRYASNAILPELGFRCCK